MIVDTLSQAERYSALIQQYLLNGQETPPVPGEGAAGGEQEPGSGARRTSL